MSARHSRYSRRIRFRGETVLQRKEDFDRCAIINVSGNCCEDNSCEAVVEEGFRRRN